MLEHLDFWPPLCYVVCLWLLKKSDKTNYPVFKQLDIIYIVLL